MCFPFPVNWSFVINMPLIDGNNPNIRYILSSIKFQAARLVANELHIEGPLGRPQDDFKPIILSENLSSAYDTLYKSYFLTIFLNVLYPHDFTYTVLPQQFRNDEQR